MDAPFYSLGNIRSDPHFSQHDWSSFSAFWDDLPLDGYMGDGGTYRRRRFSKVCYDTGDQDIRLHEETEFQQSREINRLNGGVVRRFEPLDPVLLDIAIVRQMIAHFAASIGRPDTPVHTVNIHQHRITATGTESGNPTPEGIHRDGVEHIVMMLVARTNITGGMSTLYDNDGTPLLNQTLTSPGDYIFLDDRACMHSTTPVAVAPPAAKGHRDMFFLEFC